MSVLIKGMEMPTCCCVCPCFNDEYCCCQATDKELGSVLIDRRHSDCPLIELQPHGRLIDADALLKLLDSCMFPSDMVTTRAVSMATNWIKEAPTIIHADKDGEI